jgi:hypothetical protein
MGVDVGSLPGNTPAIQIWPLGMSVVPEQLGAGIFKSWMHVVAHGEARLDMTSLLSLSPVPWPAGRPPCKPCDHGQERAGRTRPPGACPGMTTPGHPPVPAPQAVRLARMTAQPPARSRRGAARGGGEQAQGAGARDRPSPPVRAELRVQVAHVGSDDVQRDVQFAGDLRHGEVGRQVAQDPDLAVAEWRLRPGGRRRRAPSGQQAADLRGQGGVRGRLPGMALEQARRRGAAGTTRACRWARRDRARSRARPAAPGSPPAGRPGRAGGLPRR